MARRRDDEDLPEGQPEKRQRTCTPGRPSATPRPVDNPNPLSLEILKAAQERAKKTPDRPGPGIKKDGVLIDCFRTRKAATTVMVNYANQQGFIFKDEVKPHSTFEVVPCGHSGCQFGMRIDKAWKSTARKDREHRVYLVGAHHGHTPHGPSQGAILPRGLVLSFDDEPEEDTIRELALRGHAAAGPTTSAMEPTHQTAPAAIESTASTIPTPEPIPAPAAAIPTPEPIPAQEPRPAVEPAPEPSAATPEPYDCGFVPMLFSLSGDQSLSRTRQSTRSWSDASSSRSRSRSTSRSYRSRGSVQSRHPVASPSPPTFHRVSTQTTVINNMRTTAKAILLEKIGTSPEMVQIAEKYESEVFEYVGKIDNKYFSLMKGMKTLCTEGYWNKP